MITRITRHVAHSAVLVALMLALTAHSAYAQQQRQSNITGMRVLGQAVAAEFGKWEASVDTGFSAAGSRTVTLDTSSFVVPDGMGFMPITTSIPIRIDDFTVSETVTPSAVNCSSGSGICNFTATFANAHPSRFKVRSGTNGLQEAVSFMRQTGGTVLVTPDWAGTTSMIENASGSTTVGVWDMRNGAMNFYVWNGSTYAIAWGVSSDGGLIPTTITSVSVINNIRNCNAFSGANASAKITACIANLPAAGGTADARGLETSQLLASTITFTKPVNLLLGAATFTYSAGAGPAFVMYPGSTIRGLGRGISTIHVTANADGIAPAADATISDMTLQGAGGISAGASAIDGCDCANVTISGTEIKNWPSHGVNAGGLSSNWGIGPNNYIHDNEASGVFLPTTGHGHRVFNNYFAANGAHTIDINGKFMKANGNTIVGGGASHPGDCSAIVVTSIGSGITADSDGADIEGNTIRDHICSGILVRADSSGTSSHHNIKNNVISGVLGFGGIVVDTSVGGSCGDTSYINVEGNSVFNGVGYGIVQGGGAGVPCVVEANSYINNTVINNAGGGIVVAVGNGTRIEHNRALANGVGNIQLLGGTNTVEWCNQTNTAVNLCTMGSGRLAVDTIQPVSGGGVTVTSVGNTELTIGSSGVGRKAYTLFDDQFGGFNLLDVTAAVVRLNVSTAGAVTIPGGLSSPGGLLINGTSQVTRLLPGVATVDMDNTPAQTSSVKTATLANVADGDVCLLGVPAASRGSNTVWTCDVTGANQISITFGNYSAGALNPGSITFKYLVIGF